MPLTHTVRRFVAVCALVAAPTAWAEDDLNKLLNDIPDVPNAEKEVKPEEAAPVAEEEAALPAYVKSVRSSVIAAWQPKAKIIKKNPKAKARFLIKIDGNGQMTGVSVVDLSGIKAYDQSVLDAIANATFEAPPAHILTDVERGVVVTISARAYGK
jgi:TonB family protein